MLPYIDYLNIKELDLNSKLARALTEAAQDRVIVVRCSHYPPEHASRHLPVLLERKRVLVLGPQPVTPEGPMGTWDPDILWQLLVDLRTKVLKQYHWSDRPEEYRLFERGFRRIDITHELLGNLWAYYSNDPSQNLLCKMQKMY